MYPNAYRDWQFYASRTENARIRQGQSKHIQGSDRYSNAERTPSHFTLREGMSVTEETTRAEINRMEAEIGEYVKAKAGRGVPAVNEESGRWLGIEFYRDDGIIGYDAAREQDTHRMKIHYGKSFADGSPTIHGVPTLDG